MTGNELARRTGAYGAASLDERKSFAAALAQAAELLPANYWTKAQPDGNGGMLRPQPSPGKVLFMTETAAMLGIHPMAGLTSIHIIEGKPTLSASLWASLAREAGHRLRVSVEGEGEGIRAIATLVRKDDPDFEFKVVWSYADARTAGLLGKDNWKKYLRSMLKSRAITEVIREACPEVGMGAAYTAEELNPNLAVNEQGEPIELQQVPDEQPQTGRPAPAPEQPPVVPNQQPPIADEQTGETTDDTPNYSKMLEELSTYQESIELFYLAQRHGHLEEPVTYGRQRKARPLGEQIKEVGLKLKEIEAEQARGAEARAAAAAEQSGPGEEDDVVVGEPMDDDDAPMAMGGES